MRMLYHSLMIMIMDVLQDLMVKKHYIVCHTMNVEL